MPGSSLQDEIVREYCDSMDAYIEDPSPANREQMCRTGEILASLFYARLLNHAMPRVNNLTPPAEDMVQQFMELLLGGEILCEFENRHGATVSTYLSRALGYRIIDEMRKGMRRDRREAALPSEDIPEMSSSSPGNSPSNQEELLSDQQLEWVASRVLRRSIDILSLHHPHDARLILLKMEGITTSQIVRKNLLGEPVGFEDLTPQMRLKRENVVKTRHKRAKERLSIVIKRLLKEEGVSIDDMRDYLGGL